MGLPLSEVRDVSCPVCGASPGWAGVRVDAQNGAGERRARVHQGRVQAAGRKHSPEELTECRPTRVVLAEAMEAVLEDHPEKLIKLATNPAGDLSVRAAYLIDSVAPEMSALAAAFISGPAAAGRSPVSLARGHTATALVQAKKRLSTRGKDAGLVQRPGMTSERVRLEALFRAAAAADQWRASRARGSGQAQTGRGRSSQPGL